MNHSESRLRALAGGRSFLIPLSVVVLVGSLLLPTLPDGEAARRPSESKKRGAAKIALIELGRRFFYDPVVSRTGERSCASCHDPEHGFSDPATFSDDDAGTTLRHSQSLVDIVHSPFIHWDGEFESIEDLVTARIGLPRSTPGKLARGLLRVPSATGRSGGGGGYGGGSAPPKAPATPAPNPTPATSGPGKGPITPQVREKRSQRAARVSLEQSRLAFRLGRLPRAQDRLEDAERYREGVVAAFGDASITRSRVAKAIGAYCRTITSVKSPFDRRKDMREAQWSPAAERGYALFKGRAGCASCHVATPLDSTRGRVIFTDFKFRNTGIAWIDKVWPNRRDETLRTRRSARAEKDAQHAFEVAPVESQRAGIDDKGRARISTRGSDLRRFKTPSLRDVAVRAPYMHNGMFPTLHDVVRYYARGGSGDPKQDKRIRPFGVTDRDVNDIVAFLGTLTGDRRAGLASKPYRQRSKETTLRFVDSKNRPLTGVKISLVPAGDPLPVESGANSERTLTTDLRGKILFKPFNTTHVMLSLDGNYPDSVGGRLVPDSCRNATIRIPIAGTVKLDLHCYGNAKAPKTLIAAHVGTDVFDGHEPPHTLLTLERTTQIGNVSVARYTGHFRTDVPNEVEFDIPGTKDVVPLTLKSGKVLTLDSRNTQPSSFDVPKEK